MAQAPRLRFVSAAPRTVPPRTARALFGGEGTVELQLDVSDRTDVRGYGFAYDGAPVALSGGKGTFFVVPGQKRLLQWVMVGDAGGNMKVKVSRGDAVVAERKKSSIPPGFAKGYDALDILVS